MVKKDIVLFGTGKYFEDYMTYFGQEERRRPVFAVDNDESKAGSVKCGVLIQAPEVLKDLKRDEFYVVICAARYAEIARQLEDMGIVDYQHYHLMEGEAGLPPRQALSKVFRIGYLAGIFDSFHTGHLSRLRDAKSRCEYLIVGVLTDEIAKHFLKQHPKVLYSQRAQIVSEISCVDRVVPVDDTNQHMIEAWKRYHYDCCFVETGRDKDWAEEARQLRELGVNLEFLEGKEVLNVVSTGDAILPDGAQSGFGAVRCDVAGENTKDAAERYPVSNKMRRTWEVELAMLDEVDRICKTHRLQYFLVHGSLLGAVRHKGFIPWDDDLDIAMPRADYDRFVELAARELPEPLSIHTPSTEKELFWGGYARIRNGQTTALEPREMGHQGNLGIWVDVLPFDICTLDDKKFIRKEERIRYCQRLIYAERYGRDFKAYAGLRPWKWRLYRILAKVYGHERLCGMLEQAQRLYTDEASDQVAFFTGMGLYRRLQATDFEGTAELEFAGRMVPAPVGYEKYLFEIMGKDYMKYPPEEERKPKHRGIYDPDRPYTEYVGLLCDTFADVKGRQIILFGAGLMFEDYMKKYGDKYRPSFLVDNDESKWGRFRMGIPIRKPEEILEVPPEKRLLIICSYYYREISEQLDKMGICNYKVYVQEMEWILRTEEQYEADISMSTWAEMALGGSGGSGRP